MVKTVDEAIALQEGESPFVKVLRGERVDLSPVGVSGDDIICFTDSDGVSWDVTETAHGPVKVKIWSLHERHETEERQGR